MLVNQSQLQVNKGKETKQHYNGVNHKKQNNKHYL